MKKLSVLIACFMALTFMLCACGGTTETTAAATTAAQTTAAATTAAATTAAATDAATTAAAETTQAAVAAAFEEPVIVVCVGQSADLSIAKVLMTKAGVKYDVYEDGASFDGYKTAVLVPGVSTKGLGAAGISIDDELAATEVLLKEIDDAGLKVIVAHLGGSSRRDELTDKFLDVVLPCADQIFALEEGNKDSKFSDFATTQNVPCVISSDIVSMVKDVAAVFGK